MAEYIYNTKHEIEISGEVILSKHSLQKAIEETNGFMARVYSLVVEYEIDIFELLGMRNLSSFVGECFVKALERNANSVLVKNPHQDGYPDLLLVNSPAKMNYYQSLFTRKNGNLYPLSKEAFSGYRFGGIEVKATCGNTPSAKINEKPLIGESRFTMMTSFEWKAHHRQTQVLLSILWDFIDRKPAIVGCFYRNDLSEWDWGTLWYPKAPDEQQVYL